MRLATPLFLTYGRLPTMLRDELRVAVAATLDTPQGPLTIATTHLLFVGCGTSDSSPPCESASTQVPGRSG